MKALLKVDNLEDYEAILNINNVEIIVFVGICPHKVIANNVYTVKLYATTLFTPCYRELEEEHYEIKHRKCIFIFSEREIVRRGTYKCWEWDYINTQHIFEGDTYLVGKFMELKIEQLCAGHQIYD